MTDAATPPPPTEWPALPAEGMIDTILDIVAKEAAIERDRLVPEATMESLGIASYDMVMILMEIEDAFNVYVPMGDELAGTVHLADLVRGLCEKMHPDPHTPATPTQDGPQ